MSLLPLLASLVMAGAGCAAIAAMAVTVRAQLPAVRKLLADSRAIAGDRVFLVQITSVSVAAPRGIVRPRRLSARTFRVPSVAAVQPLRAAA